MQENHVPNASIPPSNQPSNSPQPQKSNVGLIVAIVVIVIAFLAQFIVPFFLVFLASSSFSNLIEEWSDDWEWSYEEFNDEDGSYNYLGKWGNDKLFLSFSANNRFVWSETIGVNGLYETGSYIVGSGDIALEKAGMTEKEAQALFGREEDFVMADFYYIELLIDSGQDVSIEEIPSRQLLVYHLNNYNITVYDTKSEKSYDLSWFVEPVNAPDETQPSDRT